MQSVQLSLSERLTDLLLVLVSFHSELNILLTFYKLILALCKVCSALEEWGFILLILGVYTYEINHSKPIEDYLPLIRDSLKNNLNRSFETLGFLEFRREFSLYMDEFIPSLIEMETKSNK